MTYFLSDPIPCVAKLRPITHQHCITKAKRQILVRWAARGMLQIHQNGNTIHEEKEYSHILHVIVSQNCMSQTVCHCSLCKLRLTSCHLHILHVNNQFRLPTSSVVTASGRYHVALSISTTLRSPPSFRTPSKPAGRRRLRDQLDALTVNPQLLLFP